MSSEFFVDAGKIVVSAIVGGALTAATALPMFNIKLTKLAGEVRSMKESCAVCKAGTEKSLTTLDTEVRAHHEDDEKHYTRASDKLMNDILTRVMRIESKLFNGHRES
jgi:hypothetical protein